MFVIRLLQGWLKAETGKMTDTLDFCMQGILKGLDRG